MQLIRLHLLMEASALFATYCEQESSLKKSGQLCLQKQGQRMILMCRREHIGVLFPQLRRLCCARNNRHAMCCFVGYGVWTEWHGLLETKENSYKDRSNLM